MKLEDYNKFYHVDISTQINNNWKDDTVLGIVKDSKKYSVRIEGKHKEILKKRFIIDEKLKSNKIHNGKVIVVIYSYLFYKALCDFDEANPLLLCRDVRPERFVINYLQKIASFFNNRMILNRKIKFRKTIEFDTKQKLPKSLAGKYTRKVYQGKLPATKILNKSDIDKLTDVISKIL